VPSEPEVRATTTGVFPTLREWTKPRLIGQHSSDLIIVLAWLIVITFVCKRQDSRLGKLVCVVLLIPLLAAQFLPSLGSPRASARSDSVQVLDRSIVGSYDTATLRASTSNHLIEWLSANGFSTGGEMAQEVDSYIREGWVFVAMRLRRDDAGQAIMTPHPMVFRFSTPAPIYPMRLTGTGSSHLKLDLYVAGDHRASVDRMRVAWCGNLDWLSAEQQESVSSQDLDGSTSWDRGRAHPEIARLSNRAAVLTKLVGSFSPQQMRSDLAIEFEPMRPARDEVYSRQAAYGLGVDAGLLATWVACVVMVVRSNWRGAVGDGGLIFLRSVGIGLIAGTLVWASLPKTVAVLSDEERRAWRDSTDQWDWLDDEEERIVRAKVGESAMDAVRRLIREKWDKNGASPRQEQASHERFAPREEDSPWQYTIQELDSGVEVTVYSVTGLPVSRIVKVER
jgi:hypothetical protein